MCVYVRGHGDSESVKCESGSVCVRERERDREREQTLDRSKPNSDNQFEVSGFNF